MKKEPPAMTPLIDRVRSMAQAHHKGSEIISCIEYVTQRGKAWDILFKKQLAANTFELVIDSIMEMQTQESPSVILNPFLYAPGVPHIYHSPDMKQLVIELKKQDLDLDEQRLWIQKWLREHKA